MKIPGFTAQLALDMAVSARQQIPYRQNEMADVIPQYMVPRPTKLSPYPGGNRFGGLLMEQGDFLGCVMNCMATYGLEHFDACSAACGR
jgi:hypothetical protein